MEIWKEILGFEKTYLISNYGNIVSIARKGSKGGLMIPRKTDKGYYRINLRLNGKNKQMLVHRLIAQAFIPNPNNYPIINHINAIRDDNRIENLEWCTMSHNVKHAINIGTLVYKKGSDSVHSKLSADKIKAIRRLYKMKKGNINMPKLAYKLNIHLSTLWRIINGQTYKLKP